MHASAARRDEASQIAIDPIRARLVEGISAAVAEKGYAATTIADIVRHARVSKRTFYEQFPDKESCFLACYRLVGEASLRAIEASIDDERPWREQIRSAAIGYFTLLEENPARTRAFMLDIHAAGPQALKLRREMMQRFADLLRALVARARRRHRDIRALSPSMAAAIIGGINELVLVSLEKGRASRLRELAQTAADLVESVLTPPRA